MDPPQFRMVVCEVLQHQGARVVPDTIAKKQKKKASIYGRSINIEGLKDKNTIKTLEA